MFSNLHRRALYVTSLYYAHSTANFLTLSDYDEQCGVHYETDQKLTNWSNTHSATPLRIYEPKSAQECVRVLQRFNSDKRKIRPVGTALSPNGIGLCADMDHSLLSVALLDKIDVNLENNTVTVGAGVRVNTVLEELKKYNLTLENFSSIQEQQLGGWTQVSAHGTGISLPPVDEMIVNLQVATPTEGLLNLSDMKSNSVHPLVNQNLFKFVKVGLGSLGVVTELQLKCIPCLDLVEETKVKTRDTIQREHSYRLNKYRHTRYMWIPHTPTVVQVTTNPYPEGVSKAKIANVKRDNDSSMTKSLCDLLLQRNKSKSEAEVSKLSFSQLRDELLDLNPLDLSLVKEINAAEASFWTKSTGYRVDDSTNILGFDCGGEQWVYEVCLPIGTLKEMEAQEAQGKQTKDVAFVQKILKIIEKEGIAAPSPIEQRWTARSTAPMSPAYSEKEDDLFTWVGIIMYLPPSQTPEQRQEITQAFNAYIDKCMPVFEEYKAFAHWAKIEIPNSEEKTAKLRNRLVDRYRVDQFNQYRRALDPNNILSNQLIDVLLNDGKENPPAKFREKKK